MTTELNRIVMRFFLTRILFNRNIEIGKQYIFIDDADNPFKEKPFGLVRVVAIKRGWVKYERVHASWLKEDSMELSSFRFCYIPYDA